MPIQVPSPNARKHARIEIIPLIDIIFFLLATFIMVSLSMVQNNSIPVNLPVVSTGIPQDPKKDTTTISVAATGDVYFNKQLMALEDLDGALKQLKLTQAEPEIFINGDAQAEFGLAVQVLDKVRRMGITKIAIQTRAGGAAPAPATPGVELAPAPGAPAATPGAAVPPAASPATPPAAATPATPPAPAPSTPPTAPAAPNPADQ